MAPVSQAFLTALDALPPGTVTGQYQGRSYVATKTGFNNGNSLKLVAEETGGRGYISLNLYYLASGARLYPCEMSAEKVTDFVLEFQPRATPRFPQQPKETASP